MLSAIFLYPRPTFPPFVLLGCLCVTFGFSAGTITDMSAALTQSRGLIFGALGSLATAADTVVVKRFLLRGGAKDESSSKSEDGSRKTTQGVLQLSWQTSLLSLGLYMPILVLSGEHVLLWKLLPSHPNTTAAQLVPLSTFYRKALLSGLASTLLTIATFLQIDVTSPTTHMIVSAARGVAQSVLAVAILGEIATSGRALGMAFVLGGSALYGWARDKEARDREKQIVNEKGPNTLEMGKL
jgi:GDP-fucose transporter C1